MLLMVTSRRFRNGRFQDEEEKDFGYYCLHGYKKGPQGKDGFNIKASWRDKPSKQKFKSVLLRELNRLKNEEGVNTPKIGIYLHGYNNDYQDGIDEIVDLEKALRNEIGYSPVIVGFSWPSMGVWPLYLSDREEVRDSVPGFVRFLVDINEFIRENERDCFATSYCIAHSMGNYLLRKGMEYASDNLGTPTGRLMFNETVMIGADIAAKDIEIDGKGRFIAQFSRRVHVYYSKHDRALKASSIKRFGQNRLGRHGANDYQSLPPNVVVIDSKKYANADSMKKARNKAGKPVRARGGKKPVSVHSSYRYHPNIVADIVQVLSSVDRSLIPRRQPVGDAPEGGLHNHFELI